ncbi:MAG: CBS domain-containing protein [Nitrospirae bacterium]|nr:MAG: CBS domain-containing protein [Nitrospirota bacterium]
MIKTEDIMHRRQAVEPDATLRKVAYKLMSTGYPGLPVVNERLEIMGVLTEHDLIKALREGADIDKAKASEIMNKEPVTADINTPVEKIIDMMLQHRFTMIPITRNNRLAGIASRDSVIEVYTEPGIWSYYSERH